ncbi:MAG: hypothetical protein ABIK09_13400 [Pseudomonadota bacterium]
MTLDTLVSLYRLGNRTLAEELAETHGLGKELAARVCGLPTRKPGILGLFTGRLPGIGRFGAALGVEGERLHAKQLRDGDRTLAALAHQIAVCASKTLALPAIPGSLGFRIERLSALRADLELDPESAGLALLLAAFGMLGNAPLDRGVIAATGTLLPSISDDLLPGLGPVDRLDLKLAALARERPEVELVLVPMANSDLDAALGPLPESFKNRVRRVRSVRDALALAHPDLALKEPPLHERVQHLEAARFRTPYDPAFQAAFLGAADELIEGLDPERHPGEVVKVHTYAAAYRLHQGRPRETCRHLDASLPLCENLWERGDPNLDPGTRCELWNIYAIERMDRGLHEAAVDACRHGLSGVTQRGRPYLHMLGTLGQALSARAATMAACGIPGSEALLEEAVEGHRFLVEHSLLDADRDRQRCYLATALSLLGRSPEAEEVLRGQLPAAVTPEGRGQLAHAGFALLRLGFIGIREGTRDALECWARRFDHWRDALVDQDAWPPAQPWPYLGILCHRVSAAARLERTEETLALVRQFLLPLLAAGTAGEVFCLIGGSTLLGAVAELGNQLGEEDRNTFSAAGLASLAKTSPEGPELQASVAAVREAFATTPSQGLARDATRHLLSLLVF